MIIFVFGESSGDLESRDFGGFYLLSMGFFPPPFLTLPHLLMISVVTIEKSPEEMYIYIYIYIYITSKEDELGMIQLEDI